MPSKRKTKLTAVGYCRTSGEIQRDNTSIPRQREAIERFCKDEGWHFAKHYVDESKSGSKVEGREDFQQMIRDAANEHFDVVVVYDITRFARNGADIIDRARFLKNTFGVVVVDTKHQFDNRRARNALNNHVHAGVSEHERIGIMERMIKGRIAKARAGKPWCGHPPYGREYRVSVPGHGWVTPKKAALLIGDTASKGLHGEWQLTDAGLVLSEMCERYAAGEQLEHFYSEYGFNSAAIARKVMREGQLSGPFKTTFNAPDIDIVDLEIVVPGMPEVITPELHARVRERANHNRTYNKEKLRKYKLTGYLRCGSCGYSLGGASNKDGSRPRYQHHSQPHGGSGRKCGTNETCGFCSIHADIIEPHALGYLYNFFLDEPEFDKAVKKALPSDDDRKKLEKEAKRVQKQLSEVEKEISNLVAAIRRGADPELLISDQNELKDEQEKLTHKLDDIEQQLSDMPDVETLQEQAMLIRLQLVQQHKGKDWWSISYDNTRRFLQFLFGDNPKRTGNGIFVRLVGGRWEITFKGRMECHTLVDGRPVYPLVKAEVEIYNRKTKKVREKLKSIPKPCTDNW